jgi:antagonist of KipI
LDEGSGMSLKILKAGMLDSIQDAGRFGYRHLGVNPTGCMDKYAAAIANSLVCNDAGEAVIEIHFPGPAILFGQTTMIAITGADFNATVSGKTVPVYHPVIINKNETLQFQSPKNKTRCYLAIRGGLKLNKWLNSYSTNLKAEAGGFYGRRLLKDDVIELNDEQDDLKINEEAFHILPWQASENFGMEISKEILVIKGSEWNWIDKFSQDKFLKNPFYISHNSDRMAYRLASEPLHTSIKTELISSAVSFGTIQILPDGQLLILMADHQTTGGYPRLGNVISAQLSRLAQMKPGDEIHFEFADQETAETLLTKQQYHLNQLQIACKLRFENYTHEIGKENY